MLTYTKQIIIEALALDCSISLVDAGFVNPAPIAYNSAGSSLVIITSYTEIFTHS